MSAAHGTVQAYHERSKHQLQRYAAGPETLDWDDQPDPFRRWAGAPLVPLPLAADQLGVRWSELHEGVPPQAMNLRSVGALFELSFALTAWKQHGPDRWAVRANPSSGNLHPTEAYLLSSGVEGLTDGLYHYAPREHGLELRASRSPGAPQLWVGLSSVQWREAWKYGERAFRYCQLDVGHAIGALRFAAAALGWQLRVVEGLSYAQLAALLGLDRAADFGEAEAEEPERLLQIGPSLSANDSGPTAWPADTRWHGGANRLDAHPMYRWPVIEKVAQATRQPSVIPVQAEIQAADTSWVPACTGMTNPLAATLIRQRRSAQHFDRRARMPAAAFFRMAAALLPRARLPWDVWPHEPHVHAVLYAHRVDGLAPGAYALARSASGASLLAEAISTGQAWVPVADAPSGLPLYCIAENPALAGALRTLSCHQAIASDACFAVSLLAEFEPLVSHEPWRYRERFQEAGLIGQVLYLQAEAEGLRGTGIGCYFDDAVHELLGLKGQQLQAFYHFTVGLPSDDGRIATTAPYAHRA